MRILDRYLLREFLLPLMYCLDAFALLWLVMDLFGTLDDFIEHHVALGQVLRYYLASFPEALVQIIPMSLLLALLFCLSNLGKHNELLAARASGVGLARLAAPLLGVGLAASLLVFAVNELFVPGARERANAMLQSFRDPKRTPTIKNLFYVNLSERRDWSAPRFDPQAGQLDNLEIHERTADGEPIRDIFADHARWTGSQWEFIGVVVQQHAPDGNLIISRAALTNFPSFTERPRQIILEAKQVQDMSASELRRIIRARERTHSTAKLDTYRVNLQYRYAFPLTCFIVMWLGIPLGMQIRRSGALKSVSVALLVVLAYYFATQISLAIGGGGRIPPVCAAWMSNLVAGLVGAGLMLRLR